MASSVSNAVTGSTPAGPSPSTSLSGFKKTLASAKLGGKSNDDLKSSTFEQLLQIPIEFKAPKRASDETRIAKPTESKPSKPEASSKPKEEKTDDEKPEETSNKTVVDPSQLLNLKYDNNDNLNLLQQPEESTVELAPIDATAERGPRQEITTTSPVVDDSATVSESPKSADTEITNEQPTDTEASLAPSDDETLRKTRTKIVDSTSQQMGTESVGPAEAIPDHLDKSVQKDVLNPGKDKLAAVNVQPAHLEQANGEDDSPRGGRRSRKDRLEEEANNPSPDYFGAKKEEIAAEKPTPIAPVVDASLSSQVNTNPSVSPQSVNSVDLAQAQATVTAASNVAPSTAGANTSGETKSISSVTGGASVGSSSFQTARNESAEKTREKPAVEQRQQLRLIQRVAKGFERIGQDGGQVRLRLHPPELGSLTVTVKIEGTQVSARMSAETTEARDILVNNLPVLKQQLADAGLTIQRFDVDVSGQGLANSGGNQGQPENMFGSSGGSGGRSSDGRMPASNRVMTGARSNAGPGVSSYSQERALDLQV